MKKILPHFRGKLQVEFQPLMTIMLEDIARSDGIDANELIMQNMARLINQRWDFKNGTPRGSSDVNS